LGKLEERCEFRSRIRIGRGVSNESFLKPRRNGEHDVNLLNERMTGR